MEHIKLKTTFYKYNLEVQRKILRENNFLVKNASKQALF